LPFDTFVKKKLKVNDWGKKHEIKLFFSKSNGRQIRLQKKFRILKVVQNCKS